MTHMVFVLHIVIVRVTRMSGVEILKISKPRFRKKLAMFDMDWTLIKPKNNKTFPSDADDWQWLRPNVPTILKQFFEKGYAIIIFTNQSKQWKQAMIVSALSSLDIPCTAVIAFDKDYKKPDRRIFDMYIQEREWDKKKSFFVGDALGRAADFADSDKKFAEAVGVKVMSPEDVFPFEQIQTPASQSIKPISHQEVVIMIGYPGSGKSSIAQEAFGSTPNYSIIESDIFKTMPKILSVARKELLAGKSVVFDATNPTKERRAEYIALAKEHKLPVRCIHVNTSMEEAIARNNARPIAKGVPKIAYYTYRKRFQEPTADEGCKVIVI